MTYCHLCDGKEATGTGRKYQESSRAKVSNINTLHIYDSSNQICLFSEIIDDKTNEIPVAQEILQTISLKNTICTFDALHMQRKTLEIIMVIMLAVSKATKQDFRSLQNQVFQTRS